MVLYTSIAALPVGVLRFGLPFLSQFPPRPQRTSFQIIVLYNKFFAGSAYPYLVGDSGLYFCVKNAAVANASSQFHVAGFVFGLRSFPSTVFAIVEYLAAFALRVETKSLR